MKNYTKLFVKAFDHPSPNVINRITSKTLLSLRRESIIATSYCSALVSFSRLSSAPQSVRTIDPWLHVIPRWWLLRIQKEITAFSDARSIVLFYWFYVSVALRVNACEETDGNDIALSEWWNFFRLFVRECLLDGAIVRYDNRVPLTISHNSCCPLFINSNPWILLFCFFFLLDGYVSSSFLFFFYFNLYILFSFCFLNL